VSNTATWATVGHVARAASMPARFAGLWSGASGTSSRITSTTWSSMWAGSENTAPPCTTRWPIASIGPSSRSTVRSICATTSRSADA
jgi:hypothetical protein